MARKKTISKTKTEVPVAKVDPSVVIFKIGKKETCHAVYPTEKMAKQSIKERGKKYTSTIIPQAKYFEMQEKGKFQMK